MAYKDPHTSIGQKVAELAHITRHELLSPALDVLLLGTPHWLINSSQLAFDFGAVGITTYAAIEGLAGDTQSALSLGALALGSLAGGEMSSRLDRRKWLVEYQG